MDSAACFPLYALVDKLWIYLKYTLEEAKLLRTDVRYMEDCMSEQQRETVTVDDLERIFIRAQDEDGKWGNVSVQDATDKQFDT